MVRRILSGLGLGVCGMLAIAAAAEPPADAKPSEPPSATAVAASDQAPASDQLPPATARQVDYTRDILPLLKTRCFECHGPDSQKAGLRLDRQEDAVRGGDSGAAFETGHSADSLLIEYVAGLDSDVIMPPKGKGTRLTAAEVGLLRAWIDQGAKYPATDKAAARTESRHWAFQPIRQPAPPQVGNPAWVRNPIDAFVLARLEKEGVSPSPEADRRTLIRRLSLDLLGLPPAPAEVEAFVEDRRPDAYEQLVERLLASPHFGERWGRHWLDLARYADSDGYEKDSPRPYAWRYRNWVIDAINRDLPFDRFTREQLAGDLLPDATLEQKVATGFHRNTLTNREGGVDKEEFRVAAVVDRVNTTSTVWLALTLGCAQCHSHKYDPLTQREYYGMFAFFNQGNELDIPAPLPAEQAAYVQAKHRYDTEHAPLVAAVRNFERQQLPTRQAAWEKTVKLTPAEWRNLEILSAKSAGGALLTTLADGSCLVSGTSPPVDTYSVTALSPAAGVTAFRLEVLPDESLPAQGPGRVSHGNFVLSEFRISLVPPKGKPKPVTLINATADYSQNRWSVDGAIDNNTKTGWAVAPAFGKRHVAVFEVGGSHLPSGTKLKITLDQRYGSQHTVGRFRISTTTAPRPVQAATQINDLTAALGTPVDKRTDIQKQQLADYYAEVDPEFAALKKAVADHARKVPAPPATKAQTIVKTDRHRTTHVHIRGDFQRKGAEVDPLTPQVLHAGSMTASSTRLDLANWLVSSENPLTPRVACNRVWQHLFGTGLVSSVDDFGTRGEPPTHPELLDWLSQQLMTLGWSRKALIRLIVNSATYRQASSTREELTDRDPTNRWLARQNRFRLEAEVVRDGYLAASGLLSSKIGGPSVRPPQPAGISELTYAGSARWMESKGADRYRRGLYTWFQRTSPYPMLMTFDAPDSNLTCTRRERSNTPLQALTLLNDPVFFECAQHLGLRLLKAHPQNVDSRIRLAFLLCMGREPTSGELADTRLLHAEGRSAFQKDPKAAKQFLGDLAVHPENLADAAATVLLSRALLNLDEFVTRE